MKFGDNLRSLRRARRISQEELAERVGVSRQSVSKWECGDAYPEMDNILKLCNIFHCKINNLVNEELVDLDSLDEDIKMTAVKFKKEKQKQMKGLSKGIYTLARIGKIILIISMFCLTLTMIVVPFITRNIEFKDNNRIEVFGEEVEYIRGEDKFTIVYDGEKNVIGTSMDAESLNKLTLWGEKHSMVVLTSFIEIAFVFLLATLVLLYFVFKHLEKLFVNLNNLETPFTMENVLHIKKMAILMIAVTLLPNVAGVIAEMILGESLEIGFEMMDLIYILFLFSMSYIFEYGYMIQLDSKGKMYGEVDE